jgi:phosphate transport system substrate-binding protein
MRKNSRARPGMRTIFASLLLLSSWSWAAAQTFVVQGSTTFTHRIMDGYQAAIEAASGHKLVVVPNKTSLGLFALLDKRADFAMISGPLANEVALLKQDHPSLQFDRLRKYPVWSTRVAFAVNKSNLVRKVTAEQMRAILLGTITNWREVGGSNLPIRVVHVREGGGVQAALEQELLDGKAMNATNVVPVQISSQVVKVIEQMPEGLGLSQLSIVADADVAELKLDRDVEQHLDLVTLGDPTPEMLKVIEAARHIANTALE